MVRNAEMAADLEHRPAAWHPDGALRVLNRDQCLAVSLDQRAQLASGDDEADCAQIRGEQAFPDVRQPDLLVCAQQRYMRFEPSAIRAQGRELMAHCQKTQRRKYRQQKRRSEQQRPHSSEQGAGARTRN